MKVCFYTLGCKVNQYETQLMKESFERAGFEISNPASDCDVFVVNSCTVTGLGDKKTRNMLSRFRRMNPDGIRVLTGCFPQAFPDDAASLGLADIVTGTSNKDKIIAHVMTYMNTRVPIIDIVPHDAEEKIESTGVTSFNEHTRAFIKIQDGCDNRCTYCIIPKARGHVRSKPPEDIINEASLLAKHGYREIVLVGINLCFYGRDLGLSFSDAINAACSVDGIDRVRLGSLEPELISDSDLDIMVSNKKLCPSFHLALQSGCDKTLKAMARRYDTAFYSDLVDRIRLRFPTASFTTDIMVGFPGETDDDFDDTLAFMKKIGFAHAHVFTYSPRPGTPAASFEQVSSYIKSMRTKVLIKYCEQLQTDFLDRQVGTTGKIIVEAKTDGFFHGYTENYCNVKLLSQDHAHRSLIDVKILSREGLYLIGE